MSVTTHFNAEHMLVWMSVSVYIWIETDQIYYPQALILLHWQADWQFYVT